MDEILDLKGICSTYWTRKMTTLNLITHPLNKGLDKFLIQRTTLTASFPVNYVANAWKNFKKQIFNGRTLKYLMESNDNYHLGME